MIGYKQAMEIIQLTRLLSEGSYRARCSRGKTVYFNTSKLMELFRTARLDGSYLKLIKKIKRSQLPVLDDLGLASFDSASRQTMMDLVEERHDQSSTTIASQISVNKWHGLIGEGTIADAILDWIVNSQPQNNPHRKLSQKKNPPITKT